MSELKHAYMHKFAACLIRRLIFQELVAQLPTDNAMHTAAVEIEAVDSSLKSAKMQPPFVDFLNGDGIDEAIIARTCGESLASLQAIKSPLGESLAHAAYQMLSTKFALWYAHKQYIEAALKQPALELDLDGDRRMWMFVASDPDGSVLFYELTNAAVWKVIFPSAEQIPLQHQS